MDKMWSIIRRKSDIDQTIENRKKQNVEITLKKMAKAQEMQRKSLEEMTKISRAINSQRQQDTVQSRQMLKQQRLIENEKTIRRAESE